MVTAVVEIGAAPRHKPGMRYIQASLNGVPAGVAFPPSLVRAGTVLFARDQSLFLMRTALGSKAPSWTTYATAQAAADYYVAPTGSDSNDGTSPSSPFASPAAATDRIALSRGAQAIVHIAPGTYDVGNYAISIPALNYSRGDTPELLLGGFDTVVQGAVVGGGTNFDVATNIAGAADDYAGLFLEVQDPTSPWNGARAIIRHSSAGPVVFSIMDGITADPNSDPVIATGTIVGVVKPNAVLLYDTLTIQGMGAANFLDWTQPLAGVGILFKEKTNDSQIYMDAASVQLGSCLIQSVFNKGGQNFTLQLYGGSTLNCSTPADVFTFLNPLAMKAGLSVSEPNAVLVNRSFLAGWYYQSRAALHSGATLVAAESRMVFNNLQLTHVRISAQSQTSIAIASQLPSGNEDPWRIEDFTSAGIGLFYNSSIVYNSGVLTSTRAATIGMRCEGGSYAVDNGGASVSGSCTAFGLQVRDNSCAAVRNPGVDWNVLGPAGNDVSVGRKPTPNIVSLAALAVATFQNGQDLSVVTTLP